MTHLHASAVFDGLSIDERADKVAAAIKAKPTNPELWRGLLRAEHIDATEEALMHLQVLVEAQATGKTFGWRVRDALYEIDLHRELVLTKAAKA